MATGNSNSLSSSGHKLGQVVGDWWELSVVFPLLVEVARELDLYLDNRCVTRPCRGEKIHWLDSDNNTVDYDFVLELKGSHTSRGVPVAFFESFWRRGARHSKDKARDDTTKLVPMRNTYPTARFLAIAASGEFTEPARDYVRSHNVELLFVSKQHIVAAFKAFGLTIDYPDNLPEAGKNALAAHLEANFSGKEVDVANQLRQIVGPATFTSFKQRVMGALTATPQTITLKCVSFSAPRTFESVEDAAAFLNDPSFEVGRGEEQFTYDVTYSDGSEFTRTLDSLDEVRKLHHELTALVTHMAKVLNRVAERDSAFGEFLASR